MTTALLFSSATFECVAEGNPQPTYQWLQRLPTPSDVIVERGREAKLHIRNVTYEYQGEYVCKVTNIIGGQERTVQSESIALQVVGKSDALFSYTLRMIFFLFFFQFFFLEFLSKVICKFILLLWHKIFFFNETVYIQI